VQFQGAYLDAWGSKGYSGAYFGLAGSILSGEGLRYPRWFSRGFMQMLATARVSGTKVSIGSTDEWFGKLLYTHKLPYIPMRIVLTVEEDDPLLKAPLMPEKYRAECWLLVHLITIEGLHKAEFAEYLRRLEGGMRLAEAFAASFNVSYEDLDQAVKEALVKGSLQLFVYEVPDESDGEQPRKLSASEADARIAKLTEVVHPTRVGSAAAASQTVHQAQPSALQR
jgi:hypothetical protein